MSLSPGGQSLQGQGTIFLTAKATHENNTPGHAAPLVSKKPTIILWKAAVGSKGIASIPRIRNLLQDGHPASVSCMLESSRSQQWWERLFAQPCKERSDTFLQSN
jgi:hypothetical protein